MEPWIDTHVHWDRYSAPERAVMLERANEAQVRFIGVAVDVASSKSLLTCDGALGVCVGVHPQRVGRPFESEIKELAPRSPVVAIGECGFDSAGAPAEAQSAAFLLQAAIARDAGLPLVLHLDGAGTWEQLLENATAADGLTVIRHYFTGDEEQADWHRLRGHYLSFGNPIRRSQALREIARHYPEDLLLIETDSYPLPNRNAEPAHVVKVGETLALVREWTFEEARERLSANTRSAFPSLPPGSAA